MRRIAISNIKIRNTIGVLEEIAYNAIYVEKRWPASQRKLNEIVRTYQDLGLLKKDNPDLSAFFGLQGSFTAFGIACGADVYLCLTGALASLQPLVEKGLISTKEFVEAQKSKTKGPVEAKKLVQIASNRLLWIADPQTYFSERLKQGALGRKYMTIEAAANSTLGLSDAQQELNQRLFPVVHMAGEPLVLRQDIKKLLATIVDDEIGFHWRYTPFNLDVPTIERAFRSYGANLGIKLDTPGILAFELLQEIHEEHTIESFRKL